MTNSIMALDQHSALGQKGEEMHRTVHQHQPNDSAPFGTVDILPIHVALLRFFVVLVLSWIMFYAAMSANAQWTVETYIPWSFWLLHYLLIFGVVGGGWPFVAPHGNSNCKVYWDGHGRVILGLLMTGLTVGVAVALSTFFVNVWWGYPLFPAGAWFGIGLFGITLWWVLDIQTAKYPFLPLHPWPPVNMAVSSLICILLSVAIFQFVDYEGPFATDSSNPQGPVQVSWWFGCVVSIIVWVQNFASIMVFQNWPFSLLTTKYHLSPLVQHFTLSVTTIFLGWATYECVIAAGVDKGFFSDAIAPSLISWSLYHTVAFDFWPFHRMVQPKRGIYSFFFSQMVLPFAWIWLCRTILQPIYDLMVQANPLYGDLFTVNTMLPWYSLHIVAPLLLVHHVYFMRWPLPPGGPPLGPMDFGIVIDLDDAFNVPPVEVKTAEGTSVLLNRMGTANVTEGHDGAETDENDIESKDSPSPK